MRRPVLAAILGLLLAGSVPGTGALAQVGGQQRIAAVVNDDVITSQELSTRVNLVLASSGAPSDPETRRRLMQQVLRAIVDEKLQMQEAKRLQLTVSDDEITRAFAAIAQRNRLDVGAFKAALAERGIGENEMRNQLRSQIAWAKVVNRELRPRVVVTQDQVDLALKEAASGAQDLELAVSEILLPVDFPADQARVLPRGRATSSPPCAKVPISVRWPGRSRWPPAARPAATWAGCDPPWSCPRCASA